MLGHGNFWWGMTPSALRAMLRAARFEVVAVPRTHASPWYTDIVARPVDRDPVLPPSPTTASAARPARPARRSRP